MNRESAVIKAAQVLGKASAHLREKGYSGLAGECDSACKDLQASVAESRALDESGASLNGLVVALTTLVKRYTAIKI